MQKIFKLCSNKSYYNNFYKQKDFLFESLLSQAFIDIIMKKMLKSHSFLAELEIKRFSA